MAITRDCRENAVVWTHKKLVRRMSTWLKNAQHMTVVISELSTRASETPDVIAWQGGESMLIECKVNRADFLSDGKKWVRTCPRDGMGDRRYFATPKGLIKPEEVPEGWGLLEVGEHNVRTIKEALHQQASKRSECVMLTSALRRLEISTAVYVVAEAP